MGQLYVYSVLVTQSHIWSYLLQHSPCNSMIFVSLTRASCHSKTENWIVINYLLTYYHVSASNRLRSYLWFIQLLFWLIWDRLLISHNTTALRITIILGSMCQYQVLFWVCPFPFLR